MRETTDDGRPYRQADDGGMRDIEQPPSLTGRASIFDGQASYGEPWKVTKRTKAWIEVLPS